MVSEQVTLYIACWLIAVAVLSVTIAELEHWRDTRDAKKAKRRDVR
jgi:hypothetical protein